MTTVQKPLRVYADTSVFGGCFHEEFETESVQFFEEVRQGQIVVVVSNVTLDELELAPDAVRKVLADLPSQQIEIISTSPESDALRKRLPGSGCCGAGFEQRRGPHCSGDHFQCGSGSELELQTHCPF
jgi:hypothetical protein